MKGHIIAGALFLAATTLASAADLKAPVKETPKLFDWSGAYAGVHLGYGWGKSDYTDNEYNGFPPAFPTVNWAVDTKGLFGGLQAGYNWQRGSAVFGIEGELGYLGLKGSAMQPGFDPFGVPYDAFGEFDRGWYGGLGGRLGYAMNRTLIYAKGGAVYSDAKVRFIDNCTAAPCGNGSIDASKKVGWGYQIGGGVEHAVTDDWTIKAEYAYLDFGRKTITGVGLTGMSTGITYNIGADLSVHTVRIGVNRRF